MPIELPAVRILIVDDDRQICDYMQMLLEKDGFAVCVVISLHKNIFINYYVVALPKPSFMTA